MGHRPPAASLVARRETRQRFDCAVLADRVPDVGGDAGTGHIGVIDTATDRPGTIREARHHERWPHAVEHRSLNDSAEVSGEPVAWEWPGYELAHRARI
jgi:hypothetical protein